MKRLKEIINLKANSQSRSQSQNIKTSEYEKLRVRFLNVEWEKVYSFLKPFSNFYSESSRRFDYNWENV